MNNFDILRNNIEYNDEYRVVKSRYDSLEVEIYKFVQKKKFWLAELTDYYKKLSVYYEEYRELILKNYHYDFIRNGNAMKNLNILTKYMSDTEELMACMLDIDTEGECML